MAPCTCHARAGAGNLAATFAIRAAAGAAEVAVGPRWRSSVSIFTRKYIAEHVLPELAGFALRARALRHLLRQQRRRSGPREARAQIAFY